jgi:hypothetical protein
MQAPKARADKRKSNNDAVQEPGKSKHAKPSKEPKGPVEPPEEKRRILKTIHAAFTPQICDDDELDGFNFREEAISNWRQIHEKIQVKQQQNPVIVTIGVPEDGGEPFVPDSENTFRMNEPVSEDKRQRELAKVLRQVWVRLPPPEEKVQIEEAHHFPGWNTRREALLAYWREDGGYQKYLTLLQARPQTSESCKAEPFIATGDCIDSCLYRFFGEAASPQFVSVNVPKDGQCFSADF